MEKEFLTISDGKFTLSETENKNQFYFYRNDGEVLTDINREPMYMYFLYIMPKMINGEIIGNVVINNICSEISDDGKCIRLTICCNTGEDSKNNTSVAINKKTNFLKRLIHKIWR